MVKGAVQQNRQGRSWNLYSHWTWNGVSVMVQIISFAVKWVLNISFPVHLDWTWKGIFGQSRDLPSSLVVWTLSWPFHITVPAVFSCIAMSCHHNSRLNLKWCFQRQKFTQNQPWQLLYVTELQSSESEEMKRQLCRRKGLVVTESDSPKA